MPYAERSDAKIYYETSGEGPAIVFAHGAGGNRMSWWQQVPYFETGHRVVRIDHRGYGRSNCEPDAFRPKQFADDFIAVLDQEGIERATLVCQSMGGWTGMRAALDHPDRLECLVLCGTPGGVMTAEVAQAAADLGKRITTEGVQGNAALAPDFPEREPELAFLYDAINDLNDKIDPSLLGRMFDQESRIAPERAAGLRVPTLFIAGEHDQLFPPDALRSVASLIDGADFILLPVCGHSTYFEDPNAFNRIVGEFVKKHVSSPG